MTTNAFKQINEAISLQTPMVRLSYPSLAKPRAFEGQEPKYQAALIIPKNADISALKMACKAAAEAKWGNRTPQNLRMPLRDGAERYKMNDAGEKVYDKGYGPDVFFMNVNGKRQPQLLDNLVQPVVGEENIQRVFYGGCYVTCIIRAFAYDRQGNKGIGFGLNAVQFLDHGEAFGGGVDGTQVFTAVHVDSGNVQQTAFDQGGQPDQGNGGGQPASPDMGLGGNTQEQAPAQSGQSAIDQLLS